MDTPRRRPRLITALSRPTYPRGYRIEALGTFAPVKPRAPDQRRVEALSRLERNVCLADKAGPLLENTNVEDRPISVFRCKGPATAGPPQGRFLQIDDGRGPARIR